MKILLLLIFCAFLVGCDVGNQAQYRVAAAATSSADRAKVREILGSVATQTKLTDATPVSKAAHTLVYYTQPEVKHFRVELGARAVGSDIIVDLYAGFGERPHTYTIAHRLLAPALSQAFGPRFIEVDESHHVP